MLRYGTEMTVRTPTPCLRAGQRLSYATKTSAWRLEVVNIAIQTFSDGWNLLTIHGRQLGAKGKSAALRFPATIPQTYTANEIEARIGLLGLILAVLRRM
jgi:hypothetical protein